MSTVVTAPHVPTQPDTRSGTRPGAAPAVAARRTFAGVMRGEWIKLLSLRSTWWALGAAAALMALASLAAAASLRFMAEDPATAAGLAEIRGAEIVSGGYGIGMVSIAVLGALLITGEYSTGMIRSTLAAVPTRVPVLAAKAIALVVVTVAVTAVGLALAYLVTMPNLTRYDLVPALDDATTWQVFGGTAYVLAAAALFSLGVGTMLRSTAGSVTVALTVLLLLPGLLAFITLDWVETVAAYLPSSAAAAFLTASETTAFGGQELSSAAGLLVIGAYAVVPLVTAAFVLHRRDA
jgi:ABC-2 type transport system permease protein